MVGLLDTKRLVERAYNGTDTKRVVVVDDDELATQEFICFGGVWLRVTELMLPNPAISPEYITRSELVERAK